jgi:hypothetical protein
MTKRIKIKYDKKKKLKEDEIVKKKLKIISNKTNRNKKKWRLNMLGKKN